MPSRHLQSLQTNLKRGSLSRLERRQLLGGSASEDQRLEVLERELEHEPLARAEGCGALPELGMSLVPLDAGQCLPPASSLDFGKASVAARDVDARA